MQSLAKLTAEAIEYFYAYTRARIALTTRETAGPFQAAAAAVPTLKDVLVVDDRGVAAGLAARCEVQVSYAIGVVKPVAIRVETFGTGRVPDAKIAAAINKLFDLSPLGIIKELNLRRPLYRQTAVYGHFGRTDIDAPWESTSRAKELAEEVAS